MMDPQTAWKQIPIMTRMACGARRPVAAADGSLSFTVLKGYRYISVRLNGADLYDVEFFRFDRAGNVKLLARCEDVFCGELGERVYDLCHGKVSG